MRGLAVFGLIAALLAPLPASAVEADAIVAQLRAQGFAQIRVSQTFLGRVRIEAQSPALHREIVLNPKTGEILRDYTDGSVAEAGRSAGSGQTTASASAGVASAGGGLTSPTGIGVATGAGTGGGIGGGSGVATGGGAVGDAGSGGTRATPGDGE